MISAPSSGTSSPGLPVQATWLLLNNILTIADLFMDPKEHFLFKSSGFGEEPVAKIFKSVILPMINLSATPVELKTIVDRVLRTQPIQCSKSELSHVLAILIKSTLLACTIAGSELVNEIEAACAWHIFMKELKEQQDEFEPTLKVIEEWKRPTHQKKWDADYDFLPEEPIQRCFLNYLGHLSTLRNVHITKAIHNLFYLLNKVAREKESNMTRRELGTFIAPTLLYVFVRNQFSPEQVDELTKKECNYFAKICEYMVKHPIFANPFRVEDYANYSQSLDGHREMRPFVVRCLFPSRVLTFGQEIKKEKTVIPEVSDEITVLNPITSSRHILARAKKVLKQVSLLPRLRFELDDKVNNRRSSSLPLKPPSVAPPSTQTGVDDVIAELRSRLILNSYDASKEKDDVRGQLVTPRRKDTKDDIKKSDGPKL